MFTYSGDNEALKGFLNAIVLVMETGFVVTGFLAVILNLLIPDIQDEDELAESAARLDARPVEEEQGRSAWGVPDEELEGGKRPRSAVARSADR